MRKPAKILGLLPGILFAALLAAISYATNYFVPLVSALLVAILLGVLVRNVSLVHPSFEAGLKFSSKTILRLGVVLLGFRLSIPQVIDLGVGPILVIVGTVISIFVCTVGLGKLMKVAHSTNLLTATGTAICGAAAVAGMSAVVKQQGAKDDPVGSAAATAVASVTLFGTLMMLAVPPVAGALGLSVTQTGVWVGASIHEVGQVVAAAGFISDQVVDIATVTKLGRVVLLAPLVAFVGLVEAQAFTRRLERRVESSQVEALLEGKAVDHEGAKKIRTPIMPLFVVGFLVAVVISSIVMPDPATAPSSLKSVFHWVDVVATLLLTVAMAAMGAGVNLRVIIKTGGKAILLGALAALVGAGISLGLTLLLVP